MELPLNGSFERFRGIYSVVDWVYMQIVVYFLVSGGSASSWRMTEEI